MQYTKLAIKIIEKLRPEIFDGHYDKGLQDDYILEIERVLNEALGDANNTTGCVVCDQCGLPSNYRTARITL